MADDDAELVQAAQRGDADAFGRLVLRYQSRIVALAASLGAGADAEDLAQDAFIRAYGSIRKFRGESTFKTWLYRVALNVARSHLEKQGRWSRIWATSRDDEDQVAPRAAVRAVFDETLVRRDLIDRALAKVPLELRTAVVLRDVQGFEYREIAEMLEIPIGTVESRIYRARQALRPLLAPLVGGEGDEHGVR
jgi:RNA polymerase sigma-70 factor, ECF subfamily